jgi:hypothetical protein
MEQSDISDLRLLSWFHYGLGALTAFTATICLPLIWIGYLWMYGSGDAVAPAQAPWAPTDDRELIGAILIATGVGAASLCLIHGAILAYIGRCLARRRRRKLCMIFSIFNLIDLPLGTILSIFTILVLRRPTIQTAFLSGNSRTDLA